MEGDEVIESGTILIKDNKIEAVGADVAVPKGYKSFDMSSKTIIPGLIEPHWHGSFAQNEIIPRENWVNYASLVFGVTTLHDPSNDTSEVFAAAELALAGLTVAPRIYSTGRILYGAKAWIFAEINNLEDARKHVKRMKASGATSVKSYNQPRRDQRQQVLKAAREENILVMPEGGSLFQHNMNMIVDGHTGIEHAIPVAKAYDDVKQLWSQTQVGYTTDVECWLWRHLGRELLVSTYRSLEAPHSHSALCRPVSYSAVQFADRWLLKRIITISRLRAPPSN